MNCRLRVSSAPIFMGVSIFVFLCALATVSISTAPLAQSQERELIARAPSRLVDPIDEHALMTLKNNVRRDAAMAPDLGPVEDAKPLNLYLLLQRTPEQQADLDHLIERQQQPDAEEYHKWLTPKQFGARFGASPDDVAKLSQWLQSHGFQVRSVLNNSSMIDFAATAGQVREAFHTQLHYVELRGGKYPALLQDPQIPAALSPVVEGIQGLNKIPARASHTEPRTASYDQAKHRWHNSISSFKALASPNYTKDSGDFDVTPQDLYTIYDINPMLNGGILGQNATVAVIEESDMEYGTVNSSTHAATGGDIATFRKLFGVPGTLNLQVLHGAGSVTCNDPGIDPSHINEDVEASLDAEWINATAPSATEIFMSCDRTVNNGIFTAYAALIDNNISDVMSLSYGESELDYTSSSDYKAQDTLYAQAATQGQSFIVAAGDSGSDLKDQNTTGTATSGINVNALGSPLVTVTGGTDFQDTYDALKGGEPQSTYWDSANNSLYGDALSYVPEMSWNDSCASSIYAAYAGYTGAGFCALGSDSVDGSVVGGSGGISTHYAVPSWQTGISGYSKSKHSQPDIAGFASPGFWGHGIIYCDSNPNFVAPENSSSPCTSASNLGLAGGTSFVAPYTAGVVGLLVNYTGSRQGLLNPALYALGKAQYTAAATKTACYSNGQTANTGVTTGLPASTCIFNDVTTGNNDVPCADGATSCYVNSGGAYGMLSLTGSSSLTVAYPSAIGFDQVTGIGSVNVANLITRWNTAFTSSTSLTATPKSLDSSKTTVLKATVKIGTPTGYEGTAPAISGSVTFKAGAAILGTCTISGVTCSITVAGTAFQSGANSVTATYAGSGTYPSSVSSNVTVTITGGSEFPATMSSPTPSSALTSPSATFTWHTSSGASGYALWIGTTGTGSENIYSTGVHTTTSAAVSGLPTSGATLYVRLWTSFSGTLLYNDYTYTEAAQSTFTSPTPSSTLSGPNVTFSWTAPAGTSGTALWIGSTGVGSNNLYSTGVHTTTSAAVTALPTNGEKIYVRLWTSFGGTLVSTDYTYTAAKLAAISSPAPSSTLAGPSVTFTWSTATGSPTGYAIWIGSTGVGSNNLYSTGVHTTTSAAVTAFPTNGETIYVRLWTSYSGTLASIDYTYTAAKQAAMISPAPGSTLSGANVTFTWSTATGSPAGYAIWIGSTGVGSKNLYSTGVHTTTSAAVTGLPTNGEKIYVRLWTSYNGTLLSTDYTYVAH